MPTEVRSKIREFIFENFYMAGETDLSDAASLFEQGIIDSTGVLEIIGFLEEQFSIQVDDRETVPENLDSIKRITAFVLRKLGEQAQEIGAQPGVQNLPRAQSGDG